uniref:Uncharacterized protein n=1 Tax=Zea mays TaxID=4577 RepID=A0A804RC80_MAIZE
MALQRLRKREFMVCRPEAEPREAEEDGSAGAENSTRESGAGSSNPYIEEVLRKVNIPVFDDEYQDFVVRYGNHLVAHIDLVKDHDQLEMV